eukprot:Skav235188  [mRNA]  locus=scaffold1938:6135:8648:+ [translate_table: standard]
MFAHDLNQSIAEAKKQRRRSAASGKTKQDSDDSDEDAEEGDEEDGDQAPEGAGGGSGSSKKWFDAETKCRKAERTWHTSVDELGKSLQETLKQCVQTVTEFRNAGAAAAEFQEELQILEKRQKWLHAILEKDEQPLQALLTEQESEEHNAAAGAAETRTTSQDIAAIGRAGPCQGYRSLKTLSMLKAMGAEYRICTSNEQIKEISDKCQNEKKLANTLVAAVKAARNDLLAAEKRLITQQKKERERAAKAAAKAKAAGKPPAGKGHDDKAGTGIASTGVARKASSLEATLFGNKSEIWTADEHRIPVCGAMQNIDDLDESQPFIQTGFQVPDTIIQACKDFKGVFESSALRITEGRAQAPAPQGSKELQDKLREDNRLRFDWSPTLLTAVTKDSPAETLLPLVTQTVFGFANSSMSKGRTEAGMCLRIIAEGTLMVAVLTLKNFDANPSNPSSSKLMQAQAAMTHGNQEALKNFAKSGELRVGTLGPGDILYLPPACIVSHRVHAQDAYGVRVGLLGAGFVERITQVANQQQSMPSNLQKILKAALAEQAASEYSAEELLNREESRSKAAVKIMQSLQQKNPQSLLEPISKEKEETIEKKPTTAENAPAAEGDPSKEKEETIKKPTPAENAPAAEGVKSKAIEGQGCPDQTQKQEQEKKKEAETKEASVDLQQETNQQSVQEAEEKPPAVAEQTAVEAEAKLDKGDDVAMEPAAKEHSGNANEPISGAPENHLPGTGPDSATDRAPGSPGKPTAGEAGSTATASKPMEIEEPKHAPGVAAAEKKKKEEPKASSKQNEKPEAKAKTQPKEKEVSKKKRKGNDDAEDAAAAKKPARAKR